MNVKMNKKKTRSIYMEYTSSNCLPVPVPVVDDANDASDTVTSYHRTIVLFFTRGPQALGHGRPFLDITVQKHVGHHTPLSTAI